MDEAQPIIGALPGEEGVPLPLQKTRAAERQSDPFGLAQDYCQIRRGRPGRSGNWPMRPVMAAAKVLLLSHDRVRRLNSLSRITAHHPRRRARRS